MPNFMESGKYNVPLCLEEENQAVAEHCLTYYNPPP